MDNYNAHGKWTQPYRTHGLLWETIETLEICEELDKLNSKNCETLLARRMLNDIGIKTDDIA
jgi:hypothetical protein